ncbi:MAG: hypothetical protein DRI39_08095 [Chloroflexi bacterium]|nr:MAG: hypothetical protein DRI39_08095 [Chloroflexota bacterium]
MRVRNVVALGLLVCLLGISAIAVGCSEKSGELVVDPSSVAVGGTVTVTGSGLSAGDKVQLVMLTDDGTVGLTGLVTPVPEADASGTFTGELSLKGFAAGTYTIQMIVDDAVVATADIELTQ